MSVRKTRLWTENDVLQREQLPVWFSAVRRINNQVISAYPQVLLLTGTRRGEVARLRWDDVDFRGEILHLRNEAKGQRIIPLTPYVATLLSAFPRLDEWVFSNQRSEKVRLEEQRIAYSQALGAAGLPPMPLHGLRHSFVDLSQCADAPLSFAIKIQGRACERRTLRPLTIDWLRHWHVKIEAWILNQAGVKFAG